jgi:hypothetical protein
MEIMTLKKKLKRMRKKKCLLSASLNPTRPNLQKQSANNKQLSSRRKPVVHLLVKLM